MSNGQRRYRFGPLERRGLVGNLGPAHLATLLGGGALTLLLLSTARGPFGVLAAFGVAVTAAGMCFVPVAGRTPVEWAPLVSRFHARTLTGRGRWDSPTPTRGASLTTGGRVVTAEPVAPDALGGVVIVPVALRGSQIGVLKEARGGLLTAVLAVRVGSFGLLSGVDQEARLAGWGGVLAAIAREGSPVRRIQWVERTAPATGGEINEHFTTHWNRTTAPEDCLAVRAYVELIAAAPAVTREHELLLAIQIDPSRLPRAARRDRANRDQAAHAVLLGEVEFLAERLRHADVEIAGLLTPPALARALRTGFDPFERKPSPDDEPADGDPDPWPTATEDGWGTYRTGGALHATYWVSAWPRTDIGPSFLAPLLLQADAVRTVAMTLAPQPPGRAIRQAEAARTADAADRHVRNKMGFLTTARHRQTEDAAARREEELASGHAAIRFTAFVTVTARTVEELERSCTSIEHAASMARLELRRLAGQQPEAFTYTLPLCRGLK